MSLYTLEKMSFEGRTELHDRLALTGAEISINTLPRGASVPFVHRHRQNEEIYIVIDGSGFLYLDGEELPLCKGDCFRIDPQGARCISAAEDSVITFVCVQVKAHSLGGFTRDDATLTDDKPSWLK